MHFLKATRYVVTCFPGGLSLSAAGMSQIGGAGGRSMSGRSGRSMGGRSGRSVGGRGAGPDSRVTFKIKDDQRGEEVRLRGEEEARALPP